MNVKLLRKVKKHILAKPIRWSWDWSRPKEESPCGTAACIGGWVCILGSRIPKGTDLAAWVEQTDEDMARRLLGITETQADKLFFYWPDQFNVHSPESAAKRIEHFIRTRGRE